MNINKFVLTEQMEATIHNVLDEYCGCGENDILENIIGGRDIMLVDINELMYFKSSISGYQMKRHPDDLSNASTDAIELVRIESFLDGILHARFAMKASGVELATT